MHVWSKPHHSLFQAALVLTAAGILGCSEQPANSAQGAPSVDGGSEEAVAALPPDRGRLLQRSAELWQHKQAGDWIQVYDFLTPQNKRGTPLFKFLSGKENHVYENASHGRVLEIDEDRGFVEVQVEWTPTHPILATVDNADGPMTQIIDEVDEWRWSEGEWCLSKQHRTSELRKTHPHLWAQDGKD